MTFDSAERYSISGVPRVFDRFGMIGPFIPDVADPLASARGVVFGVAVAVLLWAIIAVVLI